MHNTLPFIVLLSHMTVSVNIIYFDAVPQGEKFKSVTSESPAADAGECSVTCVHQNLPCQAFNYRKSDRSCQLVADITSGLEKGDGYQAFARGLNYFSIRKY